MMLQGYSHTLETLLGLPEVGINLTVHNTCVHTNNSKSQAKNGGESMCIKTEN